MSLKRIYVGGGSTGVQKVKKEVSNDGAGSSLDGRIQIMIGVCAFYTCI